MDIEQLILRLKHDESILPDPVRLEGIDPMIFNCSLEEDGAPLLEINSALDHCPADIMDFWALCCCAKLFEDKTYGQWGLEILSPQNAIQATCNFKHQRQSDHRDGDFVLGRFLGDSDLLLVRTDSNSSDFGAVIIATPIDGRSDWYYLEPSFGEFLDNYIKSKGRKYWEHQ